MRGLGADNHFPVRSAGAPTGLLPPDARIPRSRVSAPYGEVGTDAPLPPVVYLVPAFLRLAGALTCEQVIA